MSRNKKRSAGTSSKAPAPKSGGSRKAWIIASIAAVAVIGVIAIAQGGGGGASSGASASANEYLDRLLPEGYEPPKIAELSVYTKAISMTPVTATQSATDFSIPLEAVTTNKIVRFDYKRADGDTLPMLAYVRPSGKLFVGVSYCPPCEGEGQRIEADGTLTCESCGTRRNLETNEGLSGACKLYPLDEVPGTVQGDRIVLDGSILDGWTAQPLDRQVG